MFGFKYNLCNFGVMIKNATLSLDEALRKTAGKTAKEKQIRGGLSGLVEMLLREYLEKEKIKIEIN